MSKYTYESVSAVNIDVNNEAMTSAARSNPITFAESRLGGKTPGQQANILYSAVRDLGGDQNHPIVKALEKHMIEKSGITPDKIQDVVKQGKDYVEQQAVLKEFDPLSAPEKPAPKKPVVEEDFGPFQSAPIGKKVSSPAVEEDWAKFPELMDNYDKYKYTKVDKTLVEGIEPTQAAKLLLTGKTPEQQADVLYSLSRNVKNSKDPLVAALISNMEENNIATRGTLERISSEGIAFKEPEIAKEPPLQKRGSEPRLSAEEERAKLKAGLDKLMPEYIAQAEAMKPKFGDKNFAYQRVEVIPEQDPVKKEMRED